MMIIDSNRFSGKCACGKEHCMETRAAIIEQGCLRDFEKYMADYGITGRRCALYGKNSYKATEGLHPAAQQEIVLDPSGLHANEISTADVLSKLNKDTELIIAVGSGTIHDIARFCAHERGIRFVSVPTAASVDGFCSTVAAMTWHGYKKTLPAVAPEIVIADTDIIKNAPPELVKSGVGDIMAKYTALADWKIANLLTKEYLCPTIYDIMKNAADTAMASIPGILRGENEAFGKVSYALMMSGMAMQMMGNSRPASGAEHHIAHLIEVQPAGLPVSFPALHGEKTGVGAVLVSRVYHALAEIEDIAPYVKPYAPVPAEKYKTFFGGALSEAVMAENAKDCLADVTPERIVECWSGIREIISEIPAEETLYEMLKKLDAKREIEDIGVSPECMDALLEYSPLIRNRLTLMRARRMLKI